MTTESQSPWKGFFPLLLGMFALALVASFHTPSYPSITKYFGLDPKASIWINLFYTIGATAFAPVMGRLTDLFGRKRFVILGMISYIAGGLISGIATQYWILLIGRFLVGLSAAVVFPSAIAFAGENFPKEKLGRAFGIGISASTAAVIFGPTLAGLILDAWGWRVAFYTAALIGVVVIVLLSVLMPDVQKEKTAEPFDYPGSIFILVAIASLLATPNFISAAGISNVAWILMVIFMVAIIAFYITEKKSKNPLVDLDFIKNRYFIIPMLILLCTQGFQVNILYMASYFIQGAQGGSASQTGLAIMSMFIGWTLASAVSGRLSERYPRGVIFAGTLLVGCGPLMLTMLKANSPFSYIVEIMVILGIGYGFNLAAINRYAMSKANPQRMGAASGIFIMTRDIIAPFGLAVFGTIFSIQMGIKITTLLLAKAKEMGVSTELIGELAKTGVKVSPEVAGKLYKAGIDMKSLFGYAVSNGMKDAIVYVARIELVVWLIALVLCFLLPKLINTPITMQSENKNKSI